MASQEIYVDIEYYIRNCKTRLDLKYSPQIDEIHNAIRWIMRENPDIFWFAHQYHFDETTSSLYFQYTFSAERIKTIQQDILDVIDNDFCLEYVKTLTRQEQIAYVYKWLVTYCNYNPDSAYNQSIYSVFIRRNSVCTGYAKAAQYLFNLLGFKSRLVFGRLHNDKENGRHCWNIVKSDNQYYHFDASLGDNKLDYIALKSGIQELFKINGIIYNFLCVSTEEILKTRSIEDIATLPECPSSWSCNWEKLSTEVELKQREGIKGCLLSHIGSSADIYLCSKDKNTVLKVFRTNSRTTVLQEYHYMQQTKGCRYLLQCNQQYTNLTQNIIAIEQSTPIVDLLCSYYYELSLKGLIKMATDVAIAWKECQERGVLYRDIHICNIYRSSEGVFKLGDFGSCTDDFDLKETVGNQWFISPETFISGIFTEASSVYSISMVMYFILNNLHPAFWVSGCEDEALRKRMSGRKLPMPLGCAILPSHIKEKLDKFFRYASASLPTERICNIKELIYELEKLTYYCGNEDYIIHRKGIGLDLDLDAGNNDRLDSKWNYITRDEYHRYAEGLDGEENSMSEIIGETKVYGINTDYNLVSDDEVDYTADSEENECLEKNYLHVDEIESFACTMACEPYNNVDDSAMLNAKCNTLKKELLGGSKTTLGNSSTAIEEESKDFMIEIPKGKLAGGGLTQDYKCRTFLPHVKLNFFKHLFCKKSNQVYSSIFAPAEIKRKSHLQVQVYLHLYKETELVKSLANESDKNAERRDYIPLSLKLRKGDKIDIEFNIYGESRLLSKRKSLIWGGHFVKCSFDYFVPEDIDADELSCEANVFVNGAMIGEMRFLILIVDSPRNLNTEIISHRFNRIFISYAHEDAQQIKFLALAYKAQGVDYFYDRDSLSPGDVYEEEIFEYIDSSDLFILCWSKNAAESDYVAKEKNRALLRAYPHLSRKEATLKICPISIEPRADLPSDMIEVYNFEVL